MGLDGARRAKKGALANPGVLAVRVADAAMKDVLLAAGPAVFFTEPRYIGLPAVLVRPAAIGLRGSKHC